MLVGSLTYGMVRERESEFCAETVEWARKRGIEWDHGWEKEGERENKADTKNGDRRIQKKRER